MAKELPFFKFEPNQWENGNIQICTREEKGLFMDLCSVYWSRLGNLPIKLAIQKLCDGNATAFDSLLDNDIFSVFDGLVCIDFLNEQLAEFENTSKKNSENAKSRWEKHNKINTLEVVDAGALVSHCQNNTIREEKRRKDKKREENIIIPEFLEFLIYALEKEPLINENSLRRKYDAWIENDWKNGNDKKIKNWKSNLNNTFQYIEKNKSSEIIKSKMVY